MGNCLVLQSNVVRVMKTDGKIIEYKTPIKVNQILKQFSGHAISDSLKHLHPNSRLLNGHLYYLVPLTPKASKKKVRFAEPEVEGAEESGVVRIKLIITKQELQHMVQKGGISVNEMLSLAQCDRGMDVWKPVLESIPEVP